MRIYRGTVESFFSPCVSSLSLAEGLKNGRKRRCTAWEGAEFRVLETRARQPSRFSRHATRSVHGGSELTAIKQAVYAPVIAFTFSHGIPSRIVFTRALPFMNSYGSRNSVGIFNNHPRLKVTSRDASLGGITWSNRKNYLPAAIGQRDNCLNDGPR